MSKVLMKYFGSIREILGNIREEEYTVNENTTLMDLLTKYIPKKHIDSSKIYNETIFEADKERKKKDLPILKEYYMIIINGKHYKSLSKNGLKYILKDGDIIAFLPPVGGG